MVRPCLTSSRIFVYFFCLFFTLLKLKGCFPLRHLLSRLVKSFICYDFLQKICIFFMQLLILCNRKFIQYSRINQDTVLCTVRCPRFTYSTLKYFMLYTVYSTVYIVGSLKKYNQTSLVQFHW